MKLILEDFSWKGHHFDRITFNWGNVDSLDGLGYKVIDTLEDELDTAVEEEEAL